MSDGEHLAEVIPFPGKDDDERREENAPLHWESPYSLGTKACRSNHAKAEVREGTRRLVCRECEAELDPFDFVARMARELNRYLSSISALRHRQDSLIESVQRLERDERNTKARLRTAKKRMAEFEQRYGLEAKPSREQIIPADDGIAF